MKVLFVTNMYPRSEGDYYGIFVKEQVEALSSYHGIQPEVFFINGKMRYFGYLNYILSIFQVNFKLLVRKYDCVHIHYGLSGIFLFFNFWFPRRKVFVTYHGGDYLPDQGKFIQVWISRKLSKIVGKNIAINKRIFDHLRQSGIAPVLIPCGVDTDFFHPSSVESHRGGDDFRIVFPGDPARWVKNYPLYKEILTALANRINRPVKEMILVGCSRNDVLRIMQESDCMLLTSKSEASPQVVKEALACNLPVVSTRVGDVEISLLNLPGCAVFDQHETDKFIDALVSLSENTVKSTILRQRVFDLGFDQRSVCGKIFNLYRN